MTDLRRNFGDEHARYRKAAGLTQEQAANRMGFAIRTVQGYEQALRTPTAVYAAAADDAFGLNGTLANLAKLCRDDSSPFGSFLEHERRASKVRTYASLVVPGLLQTTDYARAVMKATAPDEDLDEGVKVRLERQEVLNRPQPPRLHAIIDESVLYRPIGGHATHAQQLARLLDTAPNIIVQVMPLMSGEHAGLEGDFTLLDIENDAPVVNVSSWGFSAIMDSPNDTKRAVSTFEVVAATAMSQAVTADLISEAMEYYSNGNDL